MTILKPLIQLIIVFYFLSWEKLSLSGNVLGFVYNFLTGRKQAVVANWHVSEWLPISQRIVQGSRLGPYLYIIFYAADLKPLHSYNIIIKHRRKLQGARGVPPNNFIGEHAPPQ